MIKSAHMANGRRRVRRGMTLIEAALSLGVAAFVLIGLAQLLAGAAETTKARAVADRLEEVTVAAKEYVHANFKTLYDTTPAGGTLRVEIGRNSQSASVPAGSVQAAGFLPSTYVDRNAYNQTHALLLKRVTGSPGRLEGVITSVAGQTIPDQQLGRIATFAGADAGFMLTAPVNGSTGVVTGIGGGWATPAAQWSASGTTPTVGHIMASMAFNEGALVGDYLARNDIGIPEANTMRTNLIMGGNTITEVAKLENGSTYITLNTTDNKVEIGPNVEVSGYITAGDTIHATNDITTDANVVAELDVTAKGSLHSTKFFDLDDDTYVVDPEGLSNMGTLKTESIDVNATIFDEDPATATTVTLEDRLPNYVQKAGYIATPTRAFVPKPNCRVAGAQRIILSTVQDTMRFGANVTYGTILGENSYPPLINDWINIARKFRAVDSGATWQVLPSGTPNIDNSTDNGKWIILASTYCFYPDL